MTITKRPSPPPLDLETLQLTIDTIHECLEEGFFWESRGRPGGAKAEASRRLRIAPGVLTYRLAVAERHEIRVDPSRYRPKAPFQIADLPDEGEPTAEALIERLKANFTKRDEAAEARKLYQVRIDVEGPIGVALFGDPHVDDNGCDWPALDRDVKLARDTEGVFAIGLGDQSNNWVGRLTALYANQAVTARQSLMLIEWLFGALPWLLNVAGNHDLWHTETADPLAIITRLRELPGLYEGHGARMQLNLPSGAFAIVHARHDFPGRSMFNPSHALVRETLFGYRDHILACGHRHQAGYIPVAHNDPVRLCHGFRVGSYKKHDDYAKEKGFKDENWSPAMMAVIDPDYANDPVRFIRPCFSIAEGCEYLSWRRQKWATGKRAA